MGFDPHTWGRGDTRRLSQRDYPAAVLELLSAKCGACFWGAAHDATPCDGPLQVDHLQPLSRGGDNHWSNLVWACQRHNLSKGNRRRPGKDGGPS